MHHIYCLVLSLLFSVGSVTFDSFGDDTTGFNWTRLLLMKLFGPTNLLSPPFKRLEEKKKKGLAVACHQLIMYGSLYYLLYVFSTQLYWICLPG
uniref:Ubiquitin-conjugating enzyme E2-17 kDa isoform X1 n=1 Tax=Rhizophora mucronata TaxID=61149 RepID=A0A2P2LW95_RHIMU